MKITVVGDAILDVWREYERTRDNPESVGTPVVVLQRATTAYGGACNVSGNLTAMGHEVTGFFLEPFSTKTRHTVNGRLLFREDDDCCDGPEDSVPLRIAEMLEPPLPRALVLVDYAKGAITFSLVKNLLRVLYRMASPPLCVLDLKPAAHRALIDDGDAAILMGPHVILKGNAAEIRSVLSFSPPDPAQLPAIWAQRLGWRPGLAVVTEGERGASAWYADPNPRRRGEDLRGHTERTAWNGKPADVPVSVCGAGDVFTAALVDELLRVGPSFPEGGLQRVTNRATQVVRSGRSGTLVYDPAVDG